MKYIFLGWLLLAANLSSAQDSLILRVPPFKLKPGKIPLYPGSLVTSNTNIFSGGTLVDSTEGFMVYRLPLDGMRCLVPDASNPAMTIPMVYQPPKAEGAPIPNSLKRGKR